MFKKQTDKAIILRQVPYKDNHYIVDALAEEAGKISFSFRGGKSKKLQSTRVKLRPGNLLEIEYIRSPRFYPRITAAAYDPVFQTIPADMRKTAVAMFMTEILRSVSGGTDHDLYRTARDFFIRLDRQAYDPDFHLHFLREITSLLGILPETPENGIIFASASSETQAHTMQQAAEYYFRHGHTRSRSERKRLTDAWLQYLAYHLENFHFPQSYKIFAHVWE